ncbi:MAG: ComEC/Rec2 family competence protein [Gordonia sp. (in: high G+C Gram-positive bacteria)]|uniref:ComEC/Rec2 family competence protein n=1 Tax=Gordonia sp. (in: high G+C Gram-positive bacteria) TaxID=84139 RepID=UPI0039E2DA0F
MTVDLRLAAPAAACWIMTVLALLLPSRVAVAVALAGGAAAAVAWFGARAARPAVAATLAATFGIAAVAGIACALRISATEGAPIRAARGLPVVLVEVDGDPVALRQRGEVRVPVRVLQLDRRPQRPVAASLIAPSAAVGDVVPGQRLRMRVRARPPPGEVVNRLIAARLTAVGEPTAVGRAPIWQRWAGAVRARLRDVAARALPPRAAGLFPGLVLGDTGDLDEELRENFRSAGLTHLTAVSG